MAEKKTAKILDKTPHTFWVLVFVAFSAGLIVILGIRGYSHFLGDDPKMDYPVYETLMKTHASTQQAFYKKMRGAWYIRKGTAEMILELYDDGYFTWESVDSNLRYIKLFAAGRYAENERGEILFSQMQNLDVPYNTTDLAVQVHMMSLNETAFSFGLKQGQSGTRLLVLDISNKNSQEEARITEFLQAISGSTENVTLRYLGTPNIANKRQKRS